MPRQVRLEYEGAVYHVMCRGDRREDIFEDEVDREKFLGTLAQTIERTGWHLHAYVLMSNHYHLVVETLRANLVRGMTWLQTTYTTRFNARHRRSGHVFGGRYKAIVVDAEERGYFAALVNYVHLNPARAGLAGGASGRPLIGYRWSSLPGYMFPSRRTPWLQVERGLSVQGVNDRPADRKSYLAELESRMENESEETDAARQVRAAIHRGWYLGRESFRDWLLTKGESQLQRGRESGQNYHGSEMDDYQSVRARRLIRERLEEFGLGLEELRGRSKSDPVKVEIARAIRKETTLPLRWLAEELQMGTPMNVSRLTAASLK